MDEAQRGLVSATSRSCSDEENHVMYKRQVYYLRNSKTSDVVRMGNRM